MAKPRKKSIPTLNIITFCDIITVSMVAMFMVLIIVIDQAMKTPEVRPIPLALVTTNAPHYFECRSNQVFYIDRAELERLRAQKMGELRSQSVKQEDMLQNAMNQDIGNRYYRFDNSFLMMGLVALHPREGTTGSSLADLEKPDDPVRAMLTNLNVQTTYAIFLVRDDAFAVYRKVRDLTAQRGLLTGWEYLDRGEAITFEGAMSKIRAE